MTRLPLGLVLVHAMLAAVLLKGAVSVTLFKVEVPDFKRVGEMAALLCNYSLGERERLYSVKWYKDDEEFYRYVPKSHPVSQSYKVDGVKVEHHLSNNYNVYLMSVNLRSSGLYRCEVSAEAPSFSSVNGEGRMEVVYLPKNEPQMSGSEMVYAIGDLVNINCTSSKSYPAAELRWYINNQPASGDNVVHFEPLVHKHGLITTSAGLRFEATNHHFIEGKMIVKCTSNLSLRKSDNPFQQNAPSLDNKEAMMYIMGGSAGVVCSQLLVWSCLLCVLNVAFSRRVH